MRKSCLLILLLLITGSTAMSAEQGEKISWEGFMFVVPEGWKVPHDEEQPRGKKKFKEKILFMTKDGSPLNRVEFRKRLFTAEFGNTRKRLTKGMMPQEMAEVIQNDFELDQSMKNLKVLENKPATVGGIPGFRLAFSFRDSGMLQYQCVYYGFQQEEMFYSVLFIAPKRHYFETNVGTFEEVVRNFKLETRTAPTWGAAAAN